MGLLSAVGGCFVQPRTVFHHVPEVQFVSGHRLHEPTNSVFHRDCANQQHTEGWDCDLGFQGLKFFFGNNGLGGFLGPHWKVFHPGTLSGHFQGVVIAFGSRPGGEKRVKMG